MNRQLKKDIGELAQSAAGLWIIPWAPVALAVAVAWVTEWSFPGIILSIFSLGWPPTWYLWILRGGNSEDTNQESTQQG